MSGERTPGPWFVRHLHGRDEFGVFFVDPIFVGRRESRVDNRCGEFKEADARLVAAAPELLEALRGAITALEVLGVALDEVLPKGLLPGFPQIIQEARTAVAKATGGQP